MRWNNKHVCVDSIQWCQHVLKQIDLVSLKQLDLLENILNHSRKHPHNPWKQATRALCLHEYLSSCIHSTGTYLQQNFVLCVLINLCSAYIFAYIQTFVCLTHNVKAIDRECVFSKESIIFSKNNSPPLSHSLTYSLIDNLY